MLFVRDPHYATFRDTLTFSIYPKGPDLQSKSSQLDFSNQASTKKITQSALIELRKIENLKGIVYKYKIPTHFKSDSISVVIQFGQAILQTGHVDHFW